MSLTKTKLMSQLFNVKLYLFKLLTFCILGSSYPSKRACKHITGGEKKKRGGAKKSTTEQIYSKELFPT